MAKGNQKTETKKPETVASLKAELKAVKEHAERLVCMNHKITMEYVGLKKSFEMVRENYDREKNRLDSSLDALLNVTRVIQK